MLIRLKNVLPDLLRESCSRTNIVRRKTTTFLMTEFMPIFNTLKCKKSRQKFKARKTDSVQVFGFVLARHAMV